MQHIDRTIKEENGFFYIKDIIKKNIPKVDKLKKIGEQDVVPNEYEGMQTSTITETADSYELIQVVQVKASCYYFLDVASSLKESMSKLEQMKSQLQNVIDKSKELEEDWAKFKPFVDKAALMKKKAQFMEQRKKKVQ